MSDATAAKLICQPDGTIATEDGRFYCLPYRDGAGLTLWQNIDGRKPVKIATVVNDLKEVQLVLDLHVETQIPK